MTGTYPGWGTAPALSTEEVTMFTLTYINTDNNNAKEQVSSENYRTIALFNQMWLRHHPCLQVVSLVDNGAEVDAEDMQEWWDTHTPKHMRRW